LRAVMLRHTRLLLVMPDDGDDDDNVYDEGLM
jgi:hypothetical protein